MAVPERIFAHASPQSIGGVPLFARGADIRRSTVASFASKVGATEAAIERLRRAGFEILQANRLTINFAGPPEAFEKAFRTKIVEKEVTAGMSERTVTVLDSPDTELLGHVATLGTPFDDVLEGVAIEIPRLLFEVSPRPPEVDYWHLDVPEGVARGCNSSLLHQFGVTGSGVRVAMVDSGWYAHPFFASKGFQAAPVVLGPGADSPESDESGHGTGESANIFANAPGCLLLPVKANFTNTIGAFNAAVALNPDIITCSWGSNTPFVLSAADSVLAASVAAAVASGIIVIFSAGNGHAGFPGQHPDVISAGGVYMDADGNLQASDYSSGFVSQIYPGRRVPDVCGLVGMRPRAIYIMLPVEPADNIDTDNAGNAFPDGDETAPDDGWAAFSGTSAAAPQLAGIAALIKQAVPTIGQVGVKSALAATARDVTAGFCSPVQPLHGGLPAGPGDDDATGPGLADAFAAVISAYYTNMFAGFSGVFREAPAAPPSVASLAAPIPIPPPGAPAMSGAAAFSGTAPAAGADALTSYYQAYWQGITDALAFYNSSQGMAASAAPYSGNLTCAP